MKQITKSQYLTLTGIKALADQHEKSLKELVKATIEITGEEDDMGHSADFVYGSRELDDMLNVLEIEVGDNNSLNLGQIQLSLILKQVKYLSDPERNLNEYIDAYLIKGHDGMAFLYHPAKDEETAFIDVCEHDSGADVYWPVDSKSYANLYWLNKILLLFIKDII